MSFLSLLVFLSVFYELEWRVDGDEARAASAGVGLSATIEDLPPSTRLWIQVRAIDAESGDVLATSQAVRMRAPAARREYEHTVPAAARGGAVGSTPPTSQVPNLRASSGAARGGGGSGTKLRVGARVRVRRSGAVGVVAYVGRTHFKPGRWVGVVLENSCSAHGKHDGEVDHVRYFVTPRRAKSGVFLRTAAVDLIGAQ